MISRGARKLLVITGLFVVIALGGLVALLYPQISNLESEYVTADVIRDLDSFLEKHPGQWPTSWVDLGQGSDRSVYTNFRFDLSIDSIKADPTLIYQAVIPANGRYLTYPHAKEQLHGVLERIQAGNGVEKDTTIIPHR